MAAPAVSATFDATRNGAGPLHIRTTRRAAQGACPLAYQISLSIDFTLWLTPSQVAQLTTTLQDITAAEALIATTREGPSDPCTCDLAGEGLTPRRDCPAHGDRHE